MLAKVNENGKIEIDPQEFIDSCGTEVKGFIAKHVAADEKLIEAVIGMLTEGYFFEDDWWFSIDFMQKMREKLILQMPAIVHQTVRTLIYQRDHARKLLERSEWKYWNLHHAWPAGYEYPKDNRDDPFPVVYYPDDDTVKQLTGVETSQVSDDASNDIPF